MSEIDRAIHEREAPVAEGLCRSGDRRRASNVVQVPTESPDEVCAVPAVRQVQLRLQSLLVVSDAGGVCLEKRLPVRAPFATLHLAELRGELVDAAGDLLSIRAW